MPLTQAIRIFSATAIAKNASTESSLISLRKFGPSARFWGDFSASGPGKVDVNFKVGNTPDGTFYTPPNASICVGSFLGASGNASQDRFDLSILGTPWIKFVAKECNASHVVFSMDLIVAQS